MTTSQMTMDTSKCHRLVIFMLILLLTNSSILVKAFEPRDIKIKADVNKISDKPYANIVISWSIPREASIVQESDIENGYNPASPTSDGKFN